MSKHTLLLASLVAAVTLIPTAVAGSKPRLAVVTKRPLVVKGLRFHAGERVTVTAMTALGPRVIRVTAGSAGGFKVVFRLPNQPCAAPFVIRARDAKGAVATTTVAVVTPCTPPPVD